MKRIVLLAIISALVLGFVFSQIVSVQYTVSLKGIPATEDPLALLILDRASLSDIRAYVKTNPRMLVDYSPVLGCSPLGLAGERDRADVVQLFLDFGAPVNGNAERVSRGEEYAPPLLCCGVRER